MKMNDRNEEDEGKRKGKTRRFHYTSTDIRYWAAGLFRSRRKYEKSVITRKKDSRMINDINENGTTEAQSSSLLKDTTKNNGRNIEVNQERTRLTDNSSDLMRYFKEEKHRRYHLYERSLRNNEQENRQHFRSSNFSLAASAIQNSQQIRQLSEPNVNLVNDRKIDEYNNYLRIMEEEKNYEKLKEWQNWMREQPISVLKLDKTERLVLKIGDERDAIQKKTFTKWVNKHLSKTGRRVEDLFVDLSDGLNLIALLEVLSNEHLPHENGFTRFHRIQNVQYCLDFLKAKNVKTVNIRPEDIVEGNSKLTLGLIWTIILNFQVSIIKQRQYEISNSQTEMLLSPPQSVNNIDMLSAKDALLEWAQNVTRGYPGVHVKNFSTSWRDGLAFNAILHRYRPNSINWNKISDSNVKAQDRLNNAFNVAEKEFGVSRLIDAEDVDIDNPDEKIIITYLSSLYNALPHSSLLYKGSLSDIISRLTRGIGITNEKLDHILQRIEETEVKVETLRTTDLQRTIDMIIDDLNLLETPILEFFDDVEQLKQNKHPETNDFYQQVYGLEQRRQSYLTRIRTQFITKLGLRSELLLRESEERRESIRRSTFNRVEECIQWVRTRLDKLSEMEFYHELKELENMFEEHKIDNHDIQDFRQNVDECIARQAEICAEDSHEYCELLTTLESEYQQLRDLSAGRMLDLDTLIAFIRGVEQELIWIKERQEIEICRNWSDINQLDLPMLHNYYKQLLHEIELREPIFNDVHNKGAALVNQGHPANYVIESYLREMQRQWDILLSLSKCLEQHLRDANNLKMFMEDAKAAEEWMLKQADLLERKYSRNDFALDEGEQLLHELDEINDLLKKYHSLLMRLTDRSADISPLWQRGERVEQPIPVTAIASGYVVHEGDECMLIDNSHHHPWVLSGGPENTNFSEYSVFFRIPPPDSRLTTYLNRLHANFDRLRRLWDKKHRLVRLNMVLNTMGQIRGWDLDTFASIPADERDAIIRALNDDAQKLLAELDANDPLAIRLREELRLTNEHFYDLLNQMNRPKEPNTSSQFDEEVAKLLNKLNEANRKLNDRVTQSMPRSVNDLERLILEHKDFEEALQGLDVDISTVNELFRQLASPTPSQRANHDHLNGLWEDIWELSRMYVEHLKALEGVMNGIVEVSDILRQHEITLNSYDDLPASLERLRGVHSQLLEMNMVLQQQQSIVDSLNRNIALLRQHASRTRQSSNHPDVDRLEDEIQNLTVRWENICSQVAERMKSAERALQILMIYRPEYENELAWLDKVEETINSLRRPEDLLPEQYQQQLDQLVADYNQLQERTEAIENVNREGGKFIREAKSYDSRLSQYTDNIITIHGPRIKDEFRRTQPQPKNGAQQVTEELEKLNRRFAQLSSLILEKRNVIQVLIQNWKRKKQDEIHEQCLQRQEFMSGILETLNEITSAVSQRFCFVTSTEDATLAYDRMQEVRMQLVSWSTKIRESIDEVERLCIDGADLLTPQQFHTLKEQRNRLENVYNQLLRHTDKIIECLNELAKFLLEFTNESSIMHSLINEKTREIAIIKAESGDLNCYEMSRAKAKALLEEVISSEYRIKAISSLSSRIQEKLDAYLVEMRIQYPETQFTSVDIHDLLNTLTRLQKDYEILLRSCHELNAFLNKLKICNATYSDNITKAEKLIVDIEHSISSIEEIARNNSVDVDNACILNELESLQQATVDQIALNENVSRSAFELDNALVGTDAHDRIVLENQQRIDDLERRQKRVRQRIEKDIDSWRSKIAKSEGLREGLAGILNWLDDKEEQLSNAPLLPLSIDKLGEMYRDDELAQRELTSHENVLKDLSEEIAKLVSSNPNSANRSLADQVALAKKKFSSLSAISKAQGDNLYDLLIALKNIDKNSKLLDERIEIVNDKFSRVSLADTDSIVNIRAELDDIISDWKEIQQQNNWIHAVPNIIEGSSLEQKMTKIENAVDKVILRANDLTEQQKCLLDQRKTFENLKNEFVCWLKTEENEIKALGRISCNPVELDAQRNACDKLKTDHQCHRFDLEKLDELGSKLVEIDIETFSKTKSKSTSGRVTDAQATTVFRDLSCLRQQYDGIGQMIKARFEKINSTNEKFCEWDLARDDLSRWARNECRLLDTECPVALSMDDASKNILKLERLEKICSKEKQPLIENIRSKAALLMNDSELCDTHLIEISQAEFETHWSALEDQMTIIKNRTNACKQLIQDYDNLDKWLKQKERMVSVIGAVSVDPKVIDSQVLQIEILQGEIDDQNMQRNKINEIAHELVTSNDANSLQIVNRMDALNLRWISLEENVKTMKEALQKIKNISLQFAGLHRKIKLDLLEIHENIEKTGRSALTDQDSYNEHVEKFDFLTSQIGEVEKSLGQLKKLDEMMTEISDDQTLHADVHEKVNSIQQSIREANIKIESLKTAVLNSKAEEGATMKEIEARLKWIRENRNRLAELGPISTDPRTLPEQCNQIEQIYQEVLDKEGEITLLRAKLGDQIKKASNSALKSIVESIVSEWNPILIDVKSKKANVERTTDLVKQITSSFELFNAKQMQCKASMEQLSLSKDDNSNEIFELEQQIERQNVELISLEALGQKLEELAAGPSTNKIKRDIENAINDWKILSRDVRNVTAKHMQQKESLNRYEKCKEDAMNVLQSAEENLKNLTYDKENNKLTKDAIIKTLTDLESIWQLKNRDLNAATKELQNNAYYDGNKNLDDDVVKLEQFYAHLTESLHDLRDEIEKKNDIFAHFKEDIQELNKDFRKLINIELEPIARTGEELQKQRNECEKSLELLDDKAKKCEELNERWKELSDNGVINAAGNLMVLNQLDDIKDDINKQQHVLSQRKRKISMMEQSITNNQRDIDAICGDINDLLSDEMLLGPIKTDINELRSQQESLRQFREKKLRSVGERVQSITDNCENLMKSAEPQVNVGSLEVIKNKLMDLWNDLNGRLDEREKQVCSAIQKVGDYTDTYNSLIIWLQDTEESMANQRQPSIEHKVVKEQAHANDIFLKHIEEKKQSIDGFKAMIDSLGKISTNDSQQKVMKDKSDEIVGRYGKLVEDAYKRRNRLHEALDLTKQWSEVVTPLKVWLEFAEKSLQQLGKVPTEEKQLKEQMDAQKELLNEIERKRPEFDLIIDLYPQLAQFTSVDEAAELEIIAKSFAARFLDLSTRTNECGDLLHQVAEEIYKFLDHTNTLNDWLDNVEDDMDKLESISIYPEELIEQSSFLTELALAVTQQEALVSKVVEDGRELCRQTTGDQAIALQSRIEILRSRYTELASITDTKIAVLSEALPLSERFHDGCEIVQQWMDAVEQDLQDIDQVPLEVQSTLISQIEDDLGKWRLDVDEIGGISKQLQRLCDAPRADELEAQTDDLSRRFSQLADRVTRKAEKLLSAEKQSRQVLDELDYLNEWFADARERLMNASAPAIDPEYVKKQLKNQRQMNEDIAIMKARLRDAAADARKISRALGDEVTGQDSLLATKIESGRNLSADAARMGEDRLADLEQALALCQEVDQSFGELHSWLEKIENEIDNCPTVSTGNQREQLLKQQTHNAELQLLVQSQKPLMDRFQKTVNALKELCDVDDGSQLEKIAEGIEERYEAIKEAIKQRAEALETAIEHTSRFSDRLDVILSNLGGTAAQIRNADSISADPDRIRSQISDNISLMEELKHKEGVLLSVKEQAREIMEKAKLNDTAVDDISAKIEALDHLWLELNGSLSNRGSLLEETLIKAEQFWTELQKCQKAVDDLRCAIEAIQPATGQPSIIEQQKNTLMVIEGEIREHEPLMMQNLRVAGQDLCEVVDAEERSYVEQQIDVAQNNWASITDLFVRKNTDLIDAMEKAMDFHGLLNEILNYLSNMEGKAANLAPVSGINLNEIRDELNKINELRALLDEKALQKEQLNQLCAGLCVGAQVNHSSAIRMPINDLNSRWNRLYSSLNERQQQMERALLEMGQFSQAYDQLMKWIEKTETVLDEIDPRPRNLKQAEIEICKHKVVQNDILAHEGSVDTLNLAAKRILTADPNSASITQPKIDALNARWHTLVDKLEDIWEQLNESRKAAENLGGEIDKWFLWLQDKDADLSHAKACGGLPETALAQLDDFLVLKAEIEQNRAELNAHIENAEKYLLENFENGDTWVAQREVQLKKKWVQVQEKMIDREQKLRIALADAEELHSSMAVMNEWLSSAETRLGRLQPVSRIPGTLEKQIAEQSSFQSEISVHREFMTDIHSKGTKMQYYCEKKDAIPIKNLLVSMKHRFDKIISRCTDRTKQLNSALQESQIFFSACTDLIEWIDRSTIWLNEQTVQVTSGDRVREALSKHKEFQQELNDKQPIYDSICKKGKSLSEHAPRDEQNSLNEIIENLRKKWSQICSSALQRQRDIEEMLLASGEFDEALSSLTECLAKELPILRENEKINVHGDLETVNQLFDAHKSLCEQIESRQSSMESVRRRAEQIFQCKDDTESLKGLQEKLEKLDVDWTEFNTLAKQRSARLEEALNEAKSFDCEVHWILEFLPCIEARVRAKSNIVEDENEILEQMDEIAQIRKQMDDEQSRMDSVLTAGHNIQSKCHPDAEQNMRCWIRILQTRWDEVSQMIDGKRDDLEKHLNELRNQECLIADLLKFISVKDAELKILDTGPLPEDSDVIKRLIDDHENFEMVLREHQPQIDDATKSRKRVETEIKARNSNVFPRRERSIRHPKSEQLSDRWKKLWIDSMDYGRRLREMREYLDEVKRLESFSFEEWRQRYLEWTDSGKSRISDLFRRIDKSGTGRVPRIAFIDGIIASKFNTTRLEMQKVADVFDKGDGMIDAKEFMSKLRYDYRKKMPSKQKTDGEKISEEVLRQSEQCNCYNPYKIQKVGEGHYRFGDTQIKRMVRILRSTVMVRVGGGWVALDEFLHKHDPCRAKGRTNIDLQRCFYDDVRPEGAYDTMEVFTKTSRLTPNRDTPLLNFSDSLMSTRYNITPGPITKIREKTERSMPMYNPRRASNFSHNSPLITPHSSRRQSDVTHGSQSDIFNISRSDSRCSDISENFERPTRIPSLRGKKGIGYGYSSRTNSQSH